MMNRRDALRTISITSAAALTARWISPALAAEPAPIPSGATNSAGPFVLPALAFAPNELEPHLDALTMQIHHDKHHAAYVNNLNKAIAAHPNSVGKSVEELLRDLDSLPEDLRASVRNNGGGHANHSLFWKSLTPSGGALPDGILQEAITTTFGSFPALQETMTKTALGVFGSGWAWLSLDVDKTLLVESLPNQDSPILMGHQPLFGIDVWEHAYYLHYQNRRADYVKAIWNVINWPFVATRYAELADT
jgi:Fe-Mn family superoxide dismutase